MDETKQNDKTDWGEARPVRIPGPDEGAIVDILCAAGHAYQVVYPQESAWVFYLRLTTIDGNHPSILRIVLRPKGPTGGREWSGDAKFFLAAGER